MLNLVKESEASSSTEEKSVSQQPFEAVVANQLDSESRDLPEVGSADLPPTDSIKPSDLNFPDKFPSVEAKGE